MDTQKGHARTDKVCINNKHYDRPPACAGESIPMKRTHDITLKFSVPAEEMPANYTLQNLRAAASYWISGPKFHAHVVTRTESDSPEGVAPDALSREAARGSDDLESIGHKELL